VKQKALSKQLKTAAIQLKEQQTATATLLKQTEHEKELIVAENDSLAVKVRSYENQIRVLQKEWREMHEAYQALYARYVPTEKTIHAPAAAAAAVAVAAAAVDVEVDVEVVTMAPPTAVTVGGRVDVDNAPTLMAPPPAEGAAVLSREENHSCRSASPETSNGQTSPSAEETVDDVESEKPPMSIDLTENTSEKTIPPPSPGSIAERMKLLTQKNQQKKAAAAAAAAPSPVAVGASTSATVVHSPARPRSHLSDAVSASDHTMATSAFPHPQSFQHLASVSQPTTTSHGAASMSTAALPTPAQFLQKFQQEQEQSMAKGQPSSSILSSLDDEPPADYIAQFQPPPPPKLVVHDFAKAEPDEISAYLSQMTSSFMSMLGVDEEEWDAHMEDDESPPSARVKEEELTTFRSTTGAAATAATAQSSGSPSSTSSGSIRRQSGGLSSGLQSNSTASSSSGTLSGSQSSSSFLSSLKQMSFGF
jgi:hypothetical protein